MFKALLASFRDPNETMQWAQGNGKEAVKAAASQPQKPTPKSAKRIKMEQEYATTDYQSKLGEGSGTRGPKTSSPLELENSTAENIKKRIKKTVKEQLKEKISKKTKGKESEKEVPKRKTKL